MAFAIYIAAAAAIGLLIGFVALSITWLEKAVLQNIRSKTVGLLSVYDELLEQKSRQLQVVENVQEAIRAKNREAETEKTVVRPAAQSASPRSVMEMVEQAGRVSYRDGNVSNIYRMIRENFTYSVDEIAPQLADKINSQSGPATRLLEKLDWDTVYELSTLNENHRIQVLDEALDYEGKMLVKNHIETFGSFNMLEFYEALKGIADSEPKPITLRVAPELVGHFNEYEGVDIIPDEEITEGFQVEENHLLYDYCIKARELR